MLAELVHPGRRASCRSSSRGGTPSKRQAGVSCQTVAANRRGRNTRQAAYVTDPWRRRVRKQEGSRIPAFCQDLCHSTTSTSSLTKASLSISSCSVHAERKETRDSFAQVRSVCHLFSFGRLVLSDAAVALNLGSPSSLLPCLALILCSLPSRPSSSHLSSWTGPDSASAPGSGAESMEEGTQLGRSGSNPSSTEGFPTGGGSLFYCQSFIAVRCVGHFIHSEPPTSQSHRGLSIVCIHLHFGVFWPNPSRSARERLLHYGLWSRQGCTRLMWSARWAPSIPIPQMRMRGSLQLIRRSSSMLPSLLGRLRQPRYCGSQAPVVLFVGPAGWITSGDCG